MKSAVDDLCSLFEKDNHARKMIASWKTQYESHPEKLVTMIWSSEGLITKGGLHLYTLINAALALDAAHNFNTKNDVSWTNKLKDGYDQDSQKDNNSPAYHVLKYSIKFMRLLNSSIVDLGTAYNICDRVTYRGVRAAVFQN